MVGGLCAHNARAKLLPVRSYALRPILHAKPVTISQERPRFASRLNPGPATNVAPLAPPYSTTARRRWAPAAMQQKGQPRSAKTKPSRAEDSLRDPTQAPRPLPGAPTSISLEAKRFGRWPPRTTGLPTTESKGETKDEAQQRLPASAFVLRGTAAPLGVGCWSFRSARRRGGSRRADCLSLSSERTMGLAERTARENHGACRENRPQERVARRHKMPAREPIRMRRAKAWNVEVENAYRFQCAGWRSAEEYAQGEYADEISWFGDSGLVEKVQNRQGLFMYFKRLASVSAFVLRLRGGVAAAARPSRRLGRGPRETRAPRAGTASASTSTCRASRSSSTRTTAATSRGAYARSHRLPNTRAQD